MVQPRESVPFQSLLSYNQPYTYPLGLSDQIFNVRQTIAFLSQGTTLEPGSIILTGTPKGVGFVKNPPLYLQDGDKVNVWIGHGIGTLVNDVKEEKLSDSMITSRL
jgi:2-keto-4-pentenoate hydratase/2-oxohepta-3-ene-1,7-dioic acid hydratase in catechol pathway